MRRLAWRGVRGWRYGEASLLATAGRLGFSCVAVGARDGAAARHNSVVVVGDPASANAAATLAWLRAGSSCRRVVAVLAPHVPHLGWAVADLDEVASTGRSRRHAIAADRGPSFDVCPATAPRSAEPLQRLVSAHRDASATLRQRRAGLARALQGANAASAVRRGIDLAQALCRAGRLEEADSLTACTEVAAALSAHDVRRVTAMARWIARRRAMAHQRVWAAVGVDAHGGW